MAILTSSRRGLALLSVGAVTAVTPTVASAARPSGAPGDATVIAVIDSGFSPYHYDFLAREMPQAKTRTTSDDLPLMTPPDRWLPGFPSPRSFATYQPLRITLPDSEEESPEGLYEADQAKWGEVEPSGDTINYYWLPGTKVIGALTFAPGAESRQDPLTVAPDRIHAGIGSHGAGTSSVSVGNLHGTCPECLAVLIQHNGASAAERAINWAMRQPWIDVITNSYGFSAVVGSRDRIYNGSDVALQRTASERGQTIFFSAGNGLDNSYFVPNTTLESSQEGPDWIVTVTAVSPNGGSFTGTGKPADVAGSAGPYPSAYGARTAGGKGPGFGGTSNATPTVAGTYARALYLARRALDGASRTQVAGVIARGTYRCGRVRRTCELAGGLTATELRFRLLQSAVPTGKGFTVPAVPVPPGERVADTGFAAEGHGTYAARLRGDEAWRTEFNRLWQPLAGTAQPPARPAGERDWFVVDSWCRQHIWGAWRGGYYVAGMTLPTPDARVVPATTAYRESCEHLRPPPP